jgi:hypothetical protein
MRDTSFSSIETRRKDEPCEEYTYEIDRSAWRAARD